MKNAPTTTIRPTTSRLRCAVLMNRTKMSKAAAAASADVLAGTLFRWRTRAIARPGAEHQHRRGEPEPGSDQRSPTAPGGEHAEAEQYQGHDGQHDFQVVDEPVGLLRLGQVLVREQRERGMDDGDLARDRQPARDEVLLGDGLQGRQVEGDVAVADAERAVLAAATGQDGDELLASYPVHLRPCVRHPRAGDDLLDAAVHESLNPAKAATPGRPRGRGL